MAPRPAAPARPALALALTRRAPRTGLAALWSVWTARRATRRALLRLDPHLLQDIGLSPRDAAEETAKPFWQD